MSKHDPVNLQHGCFAMIADGFAKRAIVFIHGWGGSPQTTWSHFQELLEDDSEPDVSSWWREADVYFYSYESRRYSIAEHSEVFLRFLDGIFPIPPRFIPHKPDQSPQTERYSEIYLVGHSLGAVVLREGILDRVVIAEASQRHVQESIELLQANVRLFAPAMHGAQPSGWLGLAYHLLHEIGEFGSWLEAVRRSSTIIRQLSKDSDKLKRLHDETDSWAAKTSYPALVADVVYGEEENVVDKDKFRLDRLAIAIPGVDHRSICKPTDQYHQPIDFVIRGKYAW